METKTVWKVNVGATNSCFLLLLLGVVLVVEEEETILVWGVVRKMWCFYFRGVAKKAVLTDSLWMGF